MKFTYKIKQDTFNPESPRDWDNLGTMVYWHSRGYILGDVSPRQDAQEWLETMTKENPDMVILPLFIYDHGGITMKTTPFGCQWDSGQVGYIYATREKILKDFGWTKLTSKRRDYIEGLLRSEVKTFDMYLTGDVYGYVIQKLDEDGEVEDEVDSCWGFYGMEDVEAEAQRALEYHVQSAVISVERKMFPVSTLGV